jgi:hypothetical protein
MPVRSIPIPLSGRVVVANEPDFVVPSIYFAARSTLTTVATSTSG